MKKEWKVYIVDDEEEGIEILSFELKRMKETMNIVRTFTDPREALEVIKMDPPEVLFLDIEMPWMNGFQLMEALESISFYLVFVTAYNQYALKAFKYFAIDYLLKPVNLDTLESTFENIHNHQQITSQHQVSALMDAFKEPQKGLDKLIIPTSSGYEFFDISSIIKIEADNNYSIIYSDGQSRILVSKTLKKMEELLKEEVFFRCHHSHLINLNHIQKYIKQQGGYVIMSDGSEVPISRNKREAFIELISRRWKKL